MNKQDYQLIPFQFNEADLSIYMIGREPHWIAADICEILEHTNPTMAIKSLDEDEYLAYTVFRAGQERMVNLLNEAGQDWPAFNVRIFRLKAEIIEAFGHANFMWEKGEIPPKCKD